MAIDRFYPEGSSEYLAQAHIRLAFSPPPRLPPHRHRSLTPVIDCSNSDYIFHDPTISIQTMAACAAYAAVLRFATRGDEYPISPRNTRELKSMLSEP